MPLQLSFIYLFISTDNILMYQSIPSEIIPPPPGQTPWAFDFFQNVRSKSPLCEPVARSNAPLVGAEMSL